MDRRVMEEWPFKCVRRVYDLQRGYRRRYKEDTDTDTDTDTNTNTDTDTNTNTNTNTNTVKTRRATHRQTPQAVKV